MAIRTQTQKSVHDEVISAARSIYERNGQYVVSNPGPQKNGRWCGRYIDLIVSESILSEEAYVIEVETESSVSSTEAANQWTDYDRTYQHCWYLAVPVASEQNALALLRQYGIKNCRLITWAPAGHQRYTFRGLPGAK